MNPTEKHEVDTDDIGKMDANEIRDAEVRQHKRKKYQELIRSQ